MWKYVVIRFLKERASFFWRKSSAELTVELGIANRNRVAIYRNQFKSYIQKMSGIIRNYPLEEFCETLVHDCFDNPSIYIRQPNAHKSPYNQEYCQNIDVLSFLTSPGCEYMIEKLFNSLPEHCINVAFSSRRTSSLVSGAFEANVRVFYRFP